MWFFWKAYTSYFYRKPIVLFKYENIFQIILDLRFILMSAQIESRKTWIELMAANELP